MFFSKTSSRLVFKTSSRRLQWNNFSFSKKSWRRLRDVLRDVFRTSSRHLQDVFGRRLQDVLEDEKLLCWWRVEDVFKTSWRSTIVCWVKTLGLSFRGTYAPSIELKKPLTNKRFPMLTIFTGKNYHKNFWRKNVGCFGLHYCLYNQLKFHNSIDL